jgi:putative flippase GtrA
LSQLSLIRDLYLRFQVLLHEIGKFGVVGAVGFVVQLGLQNAMYPGHGISATTSVLIATAIATTVTFLGNRYWAFRHRRTAKIARESALFVFFNVVGMLIQAGAVAIDAHVLGHTGRLSYNVATIIGVVFATLFRLFCYRRFVFREVPAIPGQSADELAAASTLP